MIEGFSVSHIGCHSCLQICVFNFLFAFLTTLHHSRDFDQIYEHVLADLSYISVKPANLFTWKNKATFWYVSLDWIDKFSCSLRYICSVYVISSIFHLNKVGTQRLFQLTFSTPSIAIIFTYLRFLDSISCLVHTRDVVLQIENIEKLNVKWKYLNENAER